MGGAGSFRKALLDLRLEMVPRDDLMCVRFVWKLSDASDSAGPVATFGGGLLTLPAIKMSDFRTPWTICTAGMPFEWVGGTGGSQHEQGGL